MADQDTEITLGAGKILGLFFGLVILCALFFGAGYTVGKNAMPAQSTLTAPASAANNGPKPSGAGSDQGAARPQDCSAPGGCAQTGANELTFYKAVGQKDPNAQLAPAEPTPETPAVTAVEQKQTPPEITKNLPAPSAAGYVVQVAAVSKQQDADALVSALRRKQYAVSVVTVPSDKLYHVQAGPFADSKEAESIRTRLVSDGYNPILKR